MARIRTIKPEFPQSETIGSVSRDARLLFVQLWTVCDDAGRTRAASRMLASLLYPYDDDAPGLIDRWLEELEQAGCVRRYAVDGATYLDVPNWLKHQKIDRPSESKIPPFDESSRMLASDRRGLALERKGREGSGSGPGGEVAREARSTPRKPKAQLVQLSDDWQPSTETIDALIAKGYTHHEIAWQRDRFVNHFRAGERRPGWDKSFFNWVTRDPPGKHNHALNPSGNGRGRTSLSAGIAQLLDALPEDEPVRN